MLFQRAMRCWSVLLVEDNPGYALLIMRAFQEAHAQARLVGARDADEALTLLEASTPDLMLLDLRLPGSGGLDVLAYVRRTEGHRDLPVVVMTSSASEADRDASLSLGADKFVTKPSTFEDLVSLVHELATRFQADAR